MFWRQPNFVRTMIALAISSDRMLLEDLTGGAASGLAPRCARLGKRAGRNAVYRTTNSACRAPAALIALRMSIRSRGPTAPDQCAVQKFAYSTAGVFTFGGKGRAELRAQVNAVNDVLDAGGFQPWGDHQIAISSFWGAGATVSGSHL
jgi:hypothetical protein